MSDKRVPKIKPVLRKRVKVVGKGLPIASNTLKQAKNEGTSVGAAAGLEGPVSARYPPSARTTRPIKIVNKPVRRSNIPSLMSIDVQQPTLLSLSREISRLSHESYLDMIRELPEDDFVRLFNEKLEALSRLRIQNNDSDIEQFNPTTYYSTSSDESSCIWQTNSTSSLRSSKKSTPREKKTLELVGEPIVIPKVECIEKVCTPISFKNEVLEKVGTPLSIKPEPFKFLATDAEQVCESFRTFEFSKAMPLSFRPKFQATEIKSNPLSVVTTSKPLQEPTEMLVTKQIPDRAFKVVIHKQKQACETKFSDSKPKAKVPLVVKSAEIINSINTSDAPMGSEPISTPINAGSITGVTTRSIVNEKDERRPSTSSNSTTTDSIASTDLNSGVIIRKPTWYNRLFFDKSNSKFKLKSHANLEIGRLTARKQQSYTDKLTVDPNYIDKNLYSFLRMQKFPKYDNRQMTLDHMHKLSCKYWQDVRKIPFSKLSAEQVNINYATVQKATDEKANGFLLALEEQEIDRRRRLVRINRWLEKHTPFARGNHHHFQ